MATQPPRPPPNNLLFCGPPPSLPRVVIVPNVAALNYTASNSALDVVLDQSNDAAGLCKINNVGVPTYDEQFCDQAQKHLLHKNLDEDQQYETYNVLRRARSVDISELYMTCKDSEFDDFVLRHRRSEPDLSKYGLFVEAEIDVQSLQAPPLVLNNPFYDGSYALTASDYNDNMIILPENYLAFEDSFVPTWDYKTNIVNHNNNPGLHYDGLPLIPPNDPWSVYGNINTAFEYYSPQFEIPTEEGVQYMRLNDLEYAMPQYMSLPTVDQVIIREPCINAEDNKEMGTNLENFENILDSKDDCIQNNAQRISSPSSPVDTTTNILLNQEKTKAAESIAIRESSRSEESLNADISNDVTSSLAFIPSSKSSPMPCGTDDTSEDTSPCSTDYHEASALDLAQSLEEHSCCDSADFSQTNEESSPIGNTVDNTQPVICVNISDCNGQCTLEALNSSMNLPLNQLPSIPNDQLPSKPPTLQSPPEQESVKKENKQNWETINSDNTNKSVDVTQSSVNITKPSMSTPTIPYINNVDTVKNPKIGKQHPQPPDVPPAWLAKTPIDKHKTNTTQDVPRIHIDNVEQAQPKDEDENCARSTNNTIIVNKPAVEPQPSCSYVPPPIPSQALQSAQLKPDKQAKEVEVSLFIYTLLLVLKYAIPNLILITNT